MQSVRRYDEHGSGQGALFAWLGIVSMATALILLVLPLASESAAIAAGVAGLGALLIAVSARRGEMPAHLMAHLSHSSYGSKQVPAPRQPESSWQSYW